MAFGIFWDVGFRDRIWLWVYYRVLDLGMGYGFWYIYRVLGLGFGVYGEKMASGKL